jgi:hypothetical protein
MDQTSHNSILQMMVQENHWTAELNISLSTKV